MNKIAKKRIEVNNKRYWKNFRQMAKDFSSIIDAFLFLLIQKKVQKEYGLIIKRKNYANRRNKN